MSKPIIVNGSADIEWMYPEIYGDRKPKDVLHISLFHTRAAGDIELEYDSERDGWCIFRNDTEKGLRTEVAFIPAWEDSEEEK